MNELSIEEQVKLIQAILYDNHEYPEKVVKPDHVPFLIFKQEE